VQPDLRLGEEPTAALAAPPAPIRVVLADEHAVMRRRLRHVLEEDRGIDVIAETDELCAAIQYVHRGRPHVLVLDLSMAVRGSIETIRRLCEQLPQTQIVVLKMESSVAFARLALDAGAAAFVVTDTADSELVEAVHLAAAGERFVSPRVAPALGRELSHRHTPAVESTV
jgi:two-component system, NarL family, response regulator NreC